MPPELIRPPPRVVVRVAIDFILRSVRAVARILDGDILGGLALLALLQRDYSQNVRSAEAVPGAASEGMPVSVKSLARSLKIPPETMRRGIIRLVAKGLCLRSPGRGISVARDGAAREEIELLMAAIRAEFLRMLADLKNIGFDFDLMDQARGHERSAPVDMADIVGDMTGLDHEQVLGLDRVILNFALRIVDSGSAPFRNDYVLGCVFSAIMSANSSPFAYDPESAWRYGTFATPPPDEIRRPVTLAEVSQMLGTPYETARRYANTLIALGLCVRDDRKSLMIPMNALQSPQSRLIATEIVGRFVQLIAELKRQGFDFQSLRMEGGAAGTATRLRL